MSHWPKCSLELQTSTNKDVDEDKNVKAGDDGHNAGNEDNNRANQTHQEATAQAEDGADEAGNYIAASKAHQM